MFFQHFVSIWLLGSVTGRFEVIPSFLYKQQNTNTNTTNNNNNNNNNNNRTTLKVLILK